jgi:hypothetical protein
VPSEFIHEQSEGKLNYAWPAQVSRFVAHGDIDLILGNLDFQNLYTIPKSRKAVDEFLGALGSDQRQIRGLGDGPVKAIDAEVFAKEPVALPERRRAVSISRRKIQLKSLLLQRVPHGID